MEVTAAQPGPGEQCPQLALTRGQSWAVQTLSGTGRLANLQASSRSIPSSPPGVTRSPSTPVSPSRRSGGEGPGEESGSEAASAQAPWEQRSPGPARGRARASALELGNRQPHTSPLQVLFLGTHLLSELRAARVPVLRPHGLNTQDKCRILSLIIIVVVVDCSKT